MYKGYVTAEMLNIRSKPVYNSTRIGQLQQYDVITVLRNSDQWLLINYLGGQAFVKSNYIEPLSDRIRLRGLPRYKEAMLWSEPNKQGTYVGSASDQIYFDILGEKGNWLKILFADQVAWIRSELVKQSISPDQQQAIVLADFLNIRSKSSGLSRKLGVIKKDSKVQIIGKDGNWHKVYFQSIVGYVHKNYIKISAQAIKLPLNRDQYWLSLGLKANKPIQNIKDQNLKNLTLIWNRYGNMLLHLSNKFKLPAAVAVALFAVESSGKGFGNNRIIIRFENHQFWRWWGRQNPALYNEHFSYDPNKVWQNHKFRPNKTFPWSSFHGKQDREWEAFEYARGMDEKAAMKSISMGLPQIMGFNHKKIGYGTVKEMFDNFSKDIRYHIIGFFEFLDPVMLAALRKGDFKQFAKLYNGPGQAEYYGEWLSVAYSRIVNLINDDPVAEDCNIFRITA